MHRVDALHRYFHPPLQQLSNDQLEIIGNRFKSSKKCQQLWRRSRPSFTVYIRELSYYHVNWNRIRWVNECTPHSPFAKQSRRVQSTRAVSLNNRRLRRFGKAFQKNGKHHISHSKAKLFWKHHWNRGFRESWAKQPKSWPCPCLRRSNSNQSLRLDWIWIVSWIQWPTFKSLLHLEARK